MCACVKEHYLVNESQFWEIKVTDDNCTRIRSGKIGKPGRKFPPKKHENQKKALRFAWCHSSVKLAHGFTDPSLVPATPRATPKRTLSRKRSTPVVAKQPPKKRKSIRGLAKQETQVVVTETPVTQKWRKPPKKQSTIRRNAAVTATPQRNQIAQQLQKSGSIQLQQAGSSTHMQRTRSVNNATRRSGSIKQISPLARVESSSSTGRSRLTSVETRPPPPPRAATPTGSRVKRLSREETLQLSTKSTMPFSVSSSLPKLSRLETLKTSNLTNQASTSSLKRIPSLTFGSDNVYIPANKEWPLSLQAPICWYDKATKSNKTNAVLVTSNACYYGTSSGMVVETGLDGCRQKMFRIPASVRCITQQENYIYIGCNNGCVYDITNNEPRYMYHTENSNFKEICGMSLQSGRFVLANMKGHVLTLDHNLKQLWLAKSSGSCGWMLCTDKSNVYHGHTHGVTKYNLHSGAVRWESSWKAGIKDGLEDGRYLYVNGGKAVYKMKKSTGHVTGSCRHESLKDISSIAVGSGMVFASGLNKLYGFDEKTYAIVYKLDTEFLAISMQYYRGRVYCAGSHGVCVVDLSKEAITRNNKSSSEACMISCDTLPFTPQNMKEAIPALTKVPSVTSVPKGSVVVQCQADKHGSLLVKPQTGTFKKQWSCEFPVNLRQEGQSYIVQGLIADEQRKMYRVAGTIQELEKSH